MPTPQSRLLGQLCALVTRDVATLESAARAAAEGATHAEARPENQYDTRGLEASYLAGAQRARLDELRGILAALVATEVVAYEAGEPIGPQALVELEHDGESTLCFVTRLGGGYRLDLDGRSVLTVTPASALGQALMGRRVGDLVTAGVGAAEREYLITGLR